MTDIMALPKYMRPDELQRKKAQKHLVYSAGAAGLAAAGMRGVPGVSRYATKRLGAKAPKWLGRAQGAGWKKASTATGVTAGVLGAGSTLTWGNSLGREIKRDEARLRAENMAKADSGWRSQVSPGAAAWHDRAAKKARFEQAATGYYGALTPALGAATVYSAKHRMPLTTAAGAVLTPLAGYKAVKHGKYAAGWTEHRRKVERRGRARAQGIPDSTPPGELRALVGKAWRPPRMRRAVLRPLGPTRGTFVRRPNGVTTYRRGSV